ncbi:hypothetical protein JCM1840_002338 [Sporobolomyces johnsonii]
MPIVHTQQCTFDFGLTGGTKYPRFTSASINCSALPGSFSLGLNDTATAYMLSWTAVKQPLEIMGGSISVSQSGGPVVGAVDIWAGNFPPTPAGQLEIPCGTKSYLKVTLTISLKTRTDQGEEAPGIQTLAARSAAFVVHPSPNNVCFDFPRTSRQLWSNEDNLRKLSAYYDSLLSSDFAEGSTSSQAVPKSSSLAEYTYDDSDAETDELELGCKVKSKKDEKQAQHQERDQKKENDGAPFKTVTITDTAYTTYYALLVWMATGYIRFAPLRSKFRSAEGGSKQARATEIDKLLSQQSDAQQFPPPASPKSVYRLAHLLELPDLVQLALDNFKSQINPANVAYELYSDVSCYYNPIRDVALEFAVANWKEVREAEGTREMERRAYAEELPKAAAGVSMMLAWKLTAK